MNFINSKDIHNIILRELEDKKAQDITVFCGKDYAMYFDYVIIATCRSNKHTVSTAEHISLLLKKEKIPSTIQGLTPGDWVLLDCSNTVTHLFQEDSRRRFNLEGLIVENSAKNIHSNNIFYTDMNGTSELTN